MASIIHGWGQDNAKAETWVLRNIPGVAALAIYPFSPISNATGQLPVDMNTRKNNHVQSIIGLHLALVLTSVHTQSSIETGMNLILCPFKSVVKLSMECRIRHIGLCSREDLSSAAVCLEPL